MAKTHWKKLSNPDYIGAYYLEPGQELILTIKEVRNEMVIGPDGKREECIVAHFNENGIKPMILNATNAKMITKLYKTPYIEDWAGKKIQVYVENVKAFGEVVEALRIRPKIPGADKPDLNPNNPKWAVAVKSIAEGTSSIEAIRKHYELSEENEAALLEEAGKEPDNA